LNLISLDCEVIMGTRSRVSIEDLYRVPENAKAEVVNGELVLMSPTGSRPGRAATRVATSLSNYEDSNGGGHAFGDNVGFLVDLPDRDSFSPDAAWYIGEIESMDFLPGAPAFAVEVRSKKDYGPAAEAAIAKKIRDYFDAGSLVVWEIDLLSDDVIKVYRATSPDNLTIHRRGEIADAEPAVPGWRYPVDDLFR
jgi:Uma2 family endonuclease